MNAPKLPASPSAPFHRRVLSRLESLYFAIQWRILFIAECCAIFVLLTVGYAAFSVLGYALLSISTIPTGHVLSVFYASLIGGIILIPVVCITSENAYRYMCDYHLAAYTPRLVSKYWMKYVPRGFITPVFIGGNALGMTILGRSSSSFDGNRVEMGHLVATSASGGFVCEVIYECIRKLVLFCASSKSPRPF